MPPLFACTLLLCLFLASGLPATLAQATGLKPAFEAAQQDDWALAAALAEQDGPASAAIIEWSRLRAGKGTLADHLAFVARHGDWPGLRLMRKRGEPNIPPDARPRDVLAYFGDNAPQTGIGALRLIAVLQDSGQAARARDVAIRAWKTLTLEAEEQAALLARHGRILAPHHTARLDMLLWQGQTEEAATLYPLVDEGQVRLAKAKAGLRRDVRGVDLLIAAVPDGLSDDAGLAWERFEWRLRKDRDDSAVELLHERSTSAARLGRPERWASRRRAQVRRLMRAGEIRVAYELASRHFLQAGSHYADLEWLSGYLALTYMKDPELALFHFRRFRSVVLTPISLGRAGYWIARAHKARGDSAAATRAYRLAARYQTGFYGQLAAGEVGVPMDPALVARRGSGNWQSIRFKRSESIKAARLLLAAGRRGTAAQFLSHVAEIVPRRDFPAFAAMIASWGDPYLSVVIGKQAALRGMAIPFAYFAPARLGLSRYPVPQALALAVALRESEFNPAVISSAGARGMMQLMPGTASDVAAELGIGYSRAKLTKDPVYNARLGTAYLKYLIDEFGDITPLVAAAYNAGPRRVQAWIAALGHPVHHDIDVIDWIEHLPFRETRNYVMRVIEARVVYEARLAGRPLPFRQSKALKGR